MFGLRNIIVLCISICIIPIKCADKYTDENRPYEFGFTIDGEQHRHEKKDENGIIMGEFGFITADGVYHVTVYATDENGNFKILSMKNIRVKPYPTTKSGPERGRSLEYSSPTQLTSKPSVPDQNKKQFKELSKPGPASPAKSCSHCKLPTTTTTTTEVPYIPSNNLPPVSPISKEPKIPHKLNQYKEKYSQNDVSAQGYIQGQQQLQLEQHPRQLQQGQQQVQQLGPRQQQEAQLLQQGKQQQQEEQILQQGQQQLQQGQQQVDQRPQEQQQQSLQPHDLQTLQQYRQGPQENQQQVRLQQQEQQQVNLQPQEIQQGQQEQKPDQFNKAQNYPQQSTGLAQNYAQLGQNKEGNYPQQSYAQEGLQSHDFTIQQQQQTQLQQSQQYSNGSPKNYPQTSQNSNDNYPQPIFAQHGLGNNPSSQTDTNQGKTISGGESKSNYPGSNVGQTPPQSVTSENQDQKSQPESNRNPKSYDNQSNQGLNALSSPAIGFVPQENSSPKKPQLISAQMQLVDKSTDIHYKRPGEKEGLPEGLSKDDMSQLLYTFNYTVGFHGHFEEGYKNGAKVGYYYVTGRNGVRTRVDYVADEKGFRPKITQEVLDLLSDDVPKPDTEKDPKYGLKGYEFKWLYYPVDTK